MKRLLLSLGLWLGLFSSAFATTAVMRDANYSLKDTDTQVTTSQAFTAIRTATLPGLGTGGTGNIAIIDAAGAINGANTLTIAAASGETINGASSIVIVLPGSNVQITRGPSGWSAVASGGSGVREGFALLGKSGTASAITGSASETQLGAVTLPGNALGSNGQLRVITYWTVTNSANNKVLRIRLGGLSGTVLFTSTQTTNASVYVQTFITNTNATNAQSAISYVARGTDALTTLSTGTSAIDTTTSQSLVFSGQLVNTGETITLVGYSVEYAN